MSKITICEGDILWTSKKDTIFHTFGGDMVFNAGHRNIWHGEKGIEIGEYKEMESLKDFPYGWWSYDFDGKKRVEFDNKSDKTGFRSHLEKIVYFQLEVSEHIPIGTEIVFQLYDYDTGLFMDWVNPDDKEFGGKEIIKTGIVRKVDEKNRITLELYLNSMWKKELVEDRGAYRDGCLDFYWKWIYNNVNWNSEKVILRVYPTEYRLRLKPAFMDKVVLPELYSKAGNLILFVMDQAPKAEIKRFIHMEVRVNTHYKSLMNINEIKKEIYTEFIDLETNKVKKSKCKIEKKNLAFKLSDDFDKVYIDSREFKIPIKKNSGLGYYNALKKTFNVGKEAASFIDKVLVLNEMKEMIPTISSNGKFNAPALSTFVGLVPGMQVVAFGMTIIEWMVLESIREMEQMVEEEMWVRWQNIKKAGLDEALKIQYVNWGIEKNFEAIDIDKETLNDLIKGKFKNRTELKEQGNKNASKGERQYYSVFVYEIIDESIDDYYDVVDCIFIKDENN
uniref:hypothetical protein n=1 Tax=Ornithobacterium rhinotracheale TaxID=28251 RepID=UPI0039A60B85